MNRALVRRLCWKKAIVSWRDKATKKNFFMVGMSLYHGRQPKA